MLRVLLVSFLMVGTFSVADSYYPREVNYQSENDVLKLKLEIYQLKEKNLELKKIIDKFKMSKEERKKYEHQEAIQDFRKQLRDNRIKGNRQISLRFQ
jgi:hypothetical protein